MKHHNPFQHLSKGLSEHEKKNFLQKVENHLDKTRKQRRTTVRQDPEQQVDAPTETSLLKRDLQNIRGLRRLSLRILAYWRSKSLEDTYRDIRIEELRKSLQVGQHPLLVGRTNAIVPLFAELLHPVYLKVKLLHRLLHYIWSNEAVISGYYRWCLRQKYSKQIKHDISDFVNENDIKDGVLTAEKAENLKKATKQQIVRYVDSLDQKIIDKIREDLLPLYYLKLLFQFPFRDFFKMFGCNNPDTLTPKFSACPSEACVRELLQLHGIGEILTGLTLEKNCTLQLANLALSTSNSGAEKDEQQFHQESQQVYEKLEECLFLWNKFAEEVPLLNLVVFAQRNPYFTHNTKLPPFQVRPAVVRELRSDLQTQLDELWERMTQQVVQATERKFIRELEGTKLTFYSQGSSVDPGRFGQLTFQHFSSLGLIHNFLLRYYPKQLRPIIVSLIKVVPKRMLLQQRLLTLANGYENISRQLKAFDSSLAPETERGKRLSNIIYRLEKGDINARVPLGELIQATDEEARYLVEKFLANLKVGHKTLNDVVKNDTDSLQQYLQATSPHQGQTPGKKVATLVSEAAAAQQEFSNLLSYSEQSH